MKFRVPISVAVGCGLFAAVGHAQSTPAPNQQRPQQPAQQQPAQKPTDSNPFPEDTTSVPVVPTTAEPAAAPAAASSAPDEPAVNTSLLKSDTDPVHSPDDPVGDSGSDGFSSSLTGSGDVNIPDEDAPAKHRRGQQ